MPVIVGQQRGKSAEIVSNDGKIDYSTELIYTVFDDLGNALEIDILKTSGLPIVNEPFQLTGVPFQLACKSKKCEQWEGNRKYWTVTCEVVSFEFPVWIPPTGGGGGGNSGGGENDNDDPESWTPQITLSFEQEDQVLLSDINGFPIVNTAKRRYASPLVRKRLIPTWKFTQYESSALTIDELMARHETLNLNEYKGKDTGTWMLLVDSCDSAFRNGRKLWKVGYCLKYKSRIYSDVYIRDQTGEIRGYSGREVGWQPVLMQIDSHDIKLNPLLDKKKNYTEDFLSITGTQLYNRELDQDGFPIYLVHLIYPYNDFSFLRI